MINFFLRILFGTKTERDIKKLQPVVALINSLEPEIRELTDEKLAEKTNEFKEHLRNGSSLEDILPEAFAVVREAARRLLGERPYDVQLMGGIALHEGTIAEMKTGEGKTLASTMPVYLNALTEKGVHIITVNDYLAKRDREWMGPIYEFLGLSVGVIQHDMPLEHKQLAYKCDITYGTNNEFGFDYLRDNMVPHKDYKMQRDLNYCIIDEVDSILIDEARTPLIISGPSEESTNQYYKVSKIISIMKKDEDFELDEKTRSVYLTEKGMKHAEQLLKIDNMFTAQNIEYQHHVTQAIRARYLFKRDVDYVVKDGKVVIVDEFTGRLMQGRRWSDGLHQAIEAKENAVIESENQTLATITFQNYFKLYNKISGMTGTAETEAQEFMEIYKLDVVVIPTNKPIIRADNQDQIYRTFQEKVNAIALELEEKYKTGQPVLVGTISIEKSEVLSRALKKKNIPHEVLNAKYHEKEAQIIKQAGKRGSITIATNMAGRGTDIVLGGYADFKEELQDNITVRSEESMQFHQLIVQGNIIEAEKVIDRFKGPEKDKALGVLCKTGLKQFEFNFVLKQ
ncbi:MAG: preprotein translocase subunit SecA, partial [Spirochaetes bacterium]|nr:preprotein translocase subunit SecA [Spirochaetota bacterium]